MTTNRQPLKATLLALFAWVGEAMHWPSSIAIDSDHEGHLVLNASFRRIDIDQVEQTIRADGRLVANFAALQSIEIKYFRGGKGLEWWTVRLNLHGQPQWQLGRTFDDLEASTVAARLASICGKDVVSCR